MKALPDEIPSRALLTIDLRALQKNYRTLKKAALQAECGAVVKTDAYGAGCEAVVRALLQEGCSCYFVATLDEACEVRELTQTSIIYVFNGLYPGTAPLFKTLNVRPVLGSFMEIEEWAAFCNNENQPPKAALHIDSGMNRLGLGVDDLQRLKEQSGLFERFEVALIISHLASADEPLSVKNHQQIECFLARLKSLPPQLSKTPLSLANSAGIFLGEAFHFDMVRPGIGLYGAGLPGDTLDHFEPVLSLQGQILQVRTAEPGETVGYGGHHKLTSLTRIATLAIGYGDGIFRTLGAGEEPTATSGVAFIGEYPAPFLGPVSMDLLTLDVTAVPEDLLHRGSFAELIGAHITLDDFAARAGTISYEVMTGFGHRLQRTYT